jgi:hypothetical protein
MSETSVFDLDAQLKEKMGKRFGVIKGKTGKFFISAIPNSFNERIDEFYQVVSEDLLYSEAVGLVKLMGDDYGSC